MVDKFSSTSSKVGNAFGVLFSLHICHIPRLLRDVISFVYCAELFPQETEGPGCGRGYYGHLCHDTR